MTEQEKYSGKRIGISLMKAIALFLIVRGCWILAKDFRPVVFTFRLFPERIEQWGFSAVILIFFSAFIVPMLYIIGGVGMLLLRRFGQYFVFAGLWFSVLFRLTGIACKWYFQVVLNSKTFIVRQGFDPVLNIAISSYILALVEVIIIIFLLRPHVRKQFRN